MTRSERSTPSAPAMGSWLGVLAVLWVATLCVAQPAAAQETNHSGDDIVILEDTTWEGRHFNIGELTIDARATLSAQPGVVLRIEAERVNVNGAISADRAGETGGRGGERGLGGRPGNGPGAGSAGAAAEGCPGADRRNAGGGGGGASGYGGSGSSGGHGGDAADGGCQGAAGGGGGGTYGSLDALRMGSGGGGGGGAGGPHYLAGADGERGGGVVEIVAREITVSGAVSANGGEGGEGGTSPDFFHGGGGGGGASGGSVYLRATYLRGSGVIAARGGGGGDGGDGDVRGTLRFGGAGGGGGGGGRVLVEVSSRSGWSGRCDVAGGSPGSGTNTNSGPAPAGSAGQCEFRTINGEPTANAGGPYLGTEWEAIPLDASASTDPDGDTLAFNWDTDGDGRFDDASGPRPSVVLGDDGVYTVRVRVADPDGLARTAEAVVTVVEVAPTAAFRFERDEVDEGDVVRVNAEDSDGGGDELVSYEWDWSFDGEFTPSGDTGPVAAHTYDDDILAAVALRVTDSDGSTATVAKQVRVRNVAPVITTTPPTDAREGEAYTYRVRVTEPGAGDRLTWAILAGPTEMRIGADGTVRWIPTYEDSLVGEFTVRVSVTDDDLGRDAQEWTVSVTPADRDGDEIPDGWELRHGLDPTDPDDRDFDPDMDRVTNIEEFRRGQHPFEFDGPTPPRIATPPNGARVGSLTPTLAIFEATDPQREPLTYEIELYDRPAGAGALPLFAVADLSASDGRVTIEISPLIGLRDNVRYFWRARAHDPQVPGAWSDTATFLTSVFNEPPEAPVLQLPLNESTVDSDMPTLSWGNATDPEDDAIRYFLVLYDDPSLSIPYRSVEGIAEDRSGITRWSADEPLDDHQTYFWRVQAADTQGLSGRWSDVWSFTVNVENVAPRGLSIIDPQPDAVVTSVQPTVVLANADDPNGDPITYRVEVSTDSRFPPESTVSSGELDEGDEGTTSWTVPEPLEDNTDYFLRAQALDPATASEFVSIAFTVNAFNDAPTAPELFMPQDGATLEAERPQLTVTNATDIDGDPLQYHFQLLGGPESRTVIAENPIVEEDPLRTTWRVNTSLAAGPYGWRVRAFDGEEHGAWSATGYFVVSTRSAGGGTGADAGLGADVDGIDNPGRPIESGCAVLGRSTGGTTRLPALVVMLLLLAGRRVRRRRLGLESSLA